MKKPGLAGKARREIEIHEGEEVDAGAFKANIRAAAVAHNTSGGKAGIGIRAGSAPARIPALSRRFGLGEYKIGQDQSDDAYKQKVPRTYT